jgi:Rrf2 family transcriptional regulator, cysteine metabolism repressor
MKLSTRARYGLRMMVELARLTDEKNPLQMGKIARVTGLSENYLAQLAMSLKNDGLLIGVSGKHGGYMLARPAARILIGEIIKAVIGPIHLTECVQNSDICMNSANCESRSIWAILNHKVEEVLDRYTLADLIHDDWMKNLREEYPNLDYLDESQLRGGGLSSGESMQGCPVSAKKT